MAIAARVCALAALVAAAGATVGKLPCLSPGEELRGQHVPLDGAAEYRLCGLAPATAYEVRLSYPASVPSVFTLAVLHPNAAGLRGSGRRALNTEKLQVATDGEALVVTAGGAVGEPLLRVTARVEGVAAPHARPRTDAVFNVALDPLWHGVPASVLGLAPAVGLALLALAAALLLLTSRHTSPLHWAGAAAEDHAFSSAHQRVD